MPIGGILARFKALLRHSFQRDDFDRQYGCLIHLHSCGLEPMAVYEQVGQAFIGHYYNCFDTNRAALGDLYQGESMCVVVKAAIYVHIP